MMPIKTMLFFLWCFGGISCTEQEAKTTGDPVVQSGENLYVRYCATCHLATGQGVTGRFPPLAQSEWVGMEPSVPIRIVLHGLQGEIVVKGEKYNNVMAAWGGTLSDEEIAKLLTFVRSSWGNSFSEISTDDVTKIREKYHGHGAWSPQELR